MQLNGKETQKLDKQIERKRLKLSIKINTVITQ